ncbi:uncharacterized protein TNIN_117371 [Trichonephila inaurata madagascariensis]|uniref:Amiloride-sensitive sodium channel n=1 Tax=Trichonephila inaurata madagascariensis TaxID=2747483 RepID=A0A8X6XLB0_9ARAC|nr:uncharacterized protein TNIN_117371 [Trichonephila inaurata madagascariensis]
MNRTLNSLSPWPRPTDLFRMRSEDAHHSPSARITFLFHQWTVKVTQLLRRRESIWGQPNAQVKEIPTTGEIRMYLTLHPEEYTNYYDLVHAHIFAHDAHSIANSMKDGIPWGLGRPTISSSTRNTRFFCSAILFACFEKCKMESMLKSSGCIAHSVSYPNNYTICEDKSSFPSDMIREKCTRECSESCRKKDLYLNFIFNRLELEMFVHEPKYESVEMFSYIGGYMGMWLGISLIALFDFLETLAFLLLYLGRSKKKVKKNAIQQNIYDM